MKFRSFRNQVKYELRFFRETAQSRVRREYPNWFGRGAAAFRGWTLRQIAVGEVDFPNEWRENPSLRIEDPADTAVVAMVSSRSELDSLIGYLAAFPRPYDLLVCADSETASGGLPKRTRAQNTVVLECESYGGDALNLVYLVNSGFLDPYKTVLRLGSLSHGDCVPVKSLVPSMEVAETILRRFETDPTLGIVAAPGMLRRSDGWGDTGPNVAEILARIDVQTSFGDLCFADGGSFWVRGFLLQGLRAMRLSRADFSDPFDPDNSPTSRALERVIGVLASEAGTSLVEIADLLKEPQKASSSTSATVIPMYSPEFFPADLNQRAWGRGFSKWNNVGFDLGRETPRYLPGKVGPYRLDTSAFWQEQSDWAKYGKIGGFLFRHYWFAGETVLEQPAQRFLNSPHINSKFALMWSNEDWVRPMSGPRQEVELAQNFDEFPAAGFIESVLPYLNDPRYLRVDGSAVIVISSPTQVVDLTTSISHWRHRADEEGVGPLLLLGVADEIGGRFDSPSHSGLDGQIVLPPRGMPWRAKRDPLEKFVSSFVGRTLSYRALARSAASRNRALKPADYPGVMVNFDSSPSKLSDADIWVGANPYAFRRWLLATVEQVASRPESQRLVFVRAWNDWSTDSVMEPTERWGPTYLQAVRDVIGGERKTL